ncbi:MAG: N-acetylneuraminate synthase family protein [Alphaproteobacteria bacterium]
MKKYKESFEIADSKISSSSETYFIADIAANHDGNLERALELINLAKESGADCAKFQHFKADKIVSDFGFRQMSEEALSHQASWEKSVPEIYEQYHTRREWNGRLLEECKKARIEFMTTPYDIDAVHDLINHVNAIKIGSGDITYLKFLEEVAKKNKPILLATGASDITEVVKAVDVVTEHNAEICLMQCNTNYTGSEENFSCVNLNVLRSYQVRYPGMPLGLSDHTPGHTCVLGAIALGARVVEKHFTDDNERIGPDHKFALNPMDWSEMVKRSRELELSLGDGIKRVESNEKETVIIQRRAVRARRKINQGEQITVNMVECLRPCPADALSASDFNCIIGKTAKRDIVAGEHLSKNDAR